MPKMSKFYSLQGAMTKAKKDGFIEWSDENHIIRSLDFFAPIFQAKYSSVGIEMSFWFEERNRHVFLCAENVSGFRYCFPLLRG